MRAAYAKDKELFEQSGDSQSEESFIYEQAKLIACSHLNDDGEDLSAGEIAGLLADEEKDLVRRVALKLICADQLRNGELLPSLQKWLADYLERETQVSVGKGRSPQRMNRTEVQAYMIGMAMTLAEEDALVRKAELRLTRNREPKHSPEAKRNREQKPNPSLCDAMQAALEEMSESRSYDYVLDMRKRFRPLSELA